MSLPRLSVKPIVMTSDSSNKLRTETAAWKEMSGEQNQTETLALSFSYSGLLKKQAGRAEFRNSVLRDNKHCIFLTHHHIISQKCHTLTETTVKIVLIIPVPIVGYTGLLKPAFLKISVE